LWQQFFTGQEMETQSRPFLQNGASAGLLFFLAGAVILMGIITAEIFYPPGYSTAQSEISDLGATRPPESIIHQPSATIFNITMIAGGLLVLAASLFLFYDRKRWTDVLFPALLGTGVLGVGLFPGNNSVLHPVFALMAFTAGGLSALVSWRMVSSPFRYVLAALGVITLVFLLFSTVFIPLLGDGGTERFIAYPVVIWMIGFGGYLAGTRDR
jgi:hypothetical membrane protein